ncbi:hypothetical protein [Arthrobacter sp. ISL-95]|uniref:hypothetical protein n=1 Tax=Arthrobacter sp. ISL-95 TaxID=2819116 RepID=UPI001BEBA767|nr:hypothetical protein [Arthrobacter sp. ISL-95]MBT2587912.1 hypothetical protein [Arthrobacter sp. ISL-95]
MNDKPRIGSDEYTWGQPGRIHVYNGDYDTLNNLVGSMDLPWGVYQGGKGLADFATFPEAIAEAQRLAAEK